MITKLKLTQFKRFRDATIELKDKGVTLLVGGNNAGKSSILHALAVWEFAKIYLENEKGANCLYAGFAGDGIGISIEDFTPINIPALKYLWTNLNYGGANGGYSLKIRCYWESGGSKDRQLEISFALTQERLFIKPTFSNLVIGDKIPVIAYLPPFAGISDREQWYSPADRKKLIGRGLAGGVLRNTIMEMFLANLEARKAAKASHAKIPKALLEMIRKTDPYEVLNSNLFEVFGVILQPKPFSPLFHNYVKIDLIKGSIVHSRFKPYAKYAKRDIMVEGSGFLQWLSVYTYAINNEIDVLLLDEPDAHLHCSLQTLLLDKLIQIAADNDKQVLIASHSTELIKHLAVDSIMEVKSTGAKYIVNDSQKVAVVGGLGTEYSPIINRLQKVKRVLFTENKSDIEILKIWCSKLELGWPSNLVEWPFANNHEQRKQLFIHLKDEISGLQALSLEDRDNVLYEDTNQNLKEKYPDLTVGASCLRYRRWRRWEIESYLISPAAIARAADKDEETVSQFLSTKFSIVIPKDHCESDRKDNTRILFDLDGKVIIEAIEKEFNISKYDILKAMTKIDVYDDVKVLIKEIIEMCK